MTPRLGAELADLEPARPGAPLSRPLFASRVPAGFPSPAEEYAEGPLDLHDYLIRHPAATFYVRVTGESMTGAGILNGDVLVVDRAREPRHGDIVVAVIDNELTVKQLDTQGPTPRLRAHHPDFAVIDLRPGQELRIWGVVGGVVRAPLPSSPYALIDANHLTRPRPWASAWASPISRCAIG
jgi:DNA polymerase V